MKVMQMIMTKDNDFSCKKNEFLEFASMSVLGDRDRQEDCFGYIMDNQSLLLCVCDGMGGYNGGKMASEAAVKAILHDLNLRDMRSNPAELLNELTIKANEEVYAIHHSNPDASSAGSTLVLIFVKDNLLYWNAVGDSRLYILRKKQLIQSTTDQNYYTVLKEKWSAGKISEEEYIQEQTHGDALVNYLGIGKLYLVDYNKEPLELKSGDQLLVCTDGLYRILSNEEIAVVLNKNADAKMTLQMMEFSVRKKSKEERKRRDNMTVSVIKVR